MRLITLTFLLFFISVTAHSFDGSGEAEIELPVIDIHPLLFPSEHTVEEVNLTFQSVSHALQKWGFFYMINHSIDTKLIRKVYSQVQNFFSLSENIKSSVQRHKDNSRGFANNEYTKQKLDLKEIYDFGPMNLEFDRLSEKAKQNAKIDGTNQWIDPKILPEFQPIIEEYYESAFQLSMKLIQAIAHHLPCFPNQNYFDQHFIDHSSFLRLNYYPTIINPYEDENAVGLGISRHTDAGVLSILWQDPYHSQLEMYSGSKESNHDGTWIPIKPLLSSRDDDIMNVHEEMYKEALLVNGGDMLQVWTNNIFKAAEHRVRATNTDTTSMNHNNPHHLLHDQEIIAETEDKKLGRYSFVFFLNPTYDAIIEPHHCLPTYNVNNPVSHLIQHIRPDPTNILPKFIPRFEKIRWGDFRQQRFEGDVAYW
jgi:isopenicillin N synthase-like dioxygenase